MTPITTSNSTSVNPTRLFNPRFDSWGICRRMAVKPGTQGVRAGRETWLIPFMVGDSSARLSRRERRLVKRIVAECLPRGVSRQCLRGSHRRKEVEAALAGRTAPLLTSGATSTFAVGSQCAREGVPPQRWPCTDMGPGGGAAALPQGIPSQGGTPNGPTRHADVIIRIAGQ